MKKEYVGLVLQGGGAIGAYECGVVKALDKHYPDFSDRLHVVSGISSGALNAAVLVGARKDPVKSLEEMWLERFSVPDVPFLPPEMQPFSWMGTPGMSCIRPDLFMTPGRVNSFYDTAPLLQTLKELVDIDQINNPRSSRHLVVAAADLETGELTWFENHRKDHKPLSYDMILASGALMPNFPAIRLADQDTGRECYYCDAGYLNNLPLDEVINVLEECDEDDSDVERVVIVVELFPMKGQVPRNLVEAENRVIQLIFSSKMQLDQKFFGKIDAYSRLMKIIDAYLTPEGRDQIKKKDLNKAYEELKGHKVIKPIIITSHMPEPLSAATDFSRTAIEDRIECGYQDACDTLREHHLI